MNQKSQIIAIYSVVAVVSVAMVVYFNKLGNDVPEQDLPPVSNAGRVTVDKFYPISEDIELTKQDGVEVKLSDIRGKVTVLAQFFAVCPKCAQRNGTELLDLYETFGDNPDFRIVCITVDPDTDGVEELKDYANVFGAKPDNWWFARADGEKKTHDYLEHVLKFFEIRLRTDEVDIASNGRFAHDLGFLVIDRDFNVVGKWPIADAASEEGRKLDPTSYGRLKKEMYDRIEKELTKNDE